MDKIKCHKCNKNIKLLKFECKCHEFFCINHKDPESHLCTFDFKINGKNEFILNNPIIMPQKLTKI